MQNFKKIEGRFFFIGNKSLVADKRTISKTIQNSDSWDSSAEPFVG